MGSSLSRLWQKVGLTRVYVPPYTRLNEEGHIEHVDGYWRDRGDLFGGMERLAVNRSVVSSDHPYRNKTTTYFESRTCSRCGGTGNVTQGNAIDGTICYGCQGRGRVLTKKGSLGLADYLADEKEANSKPAVDVRVGDRVYFPSESSPVGSRKGGWATVKDVKERPASAWVRGQERGTEIQITFEGGSPLGEGRVVSLDTAVRYKGAPGPFPDPKDYPGYVGFRPEGWRFGGRVGTPDGAPLASDLAREAREKREAQRAAEVAAAEAFVSPRIDALGEFDFLKPADRDRYRETVKGYLEGLSEEELRPFHIWWNVGVYTGEEGRRTNIESLTDAIYNDRTPDPKDFADEDWRRYDNAKFLRDSDVGKVLEQSEDGSAVFTLGKGNLVRAPDAEADEYGTGAWSDEDGPMHPKAAAMVEAWYREAQARGFVAPKVKAQREAEEAAKAPAEVSSNLAPAFAILDKGKVTDADITAELMDAALAALDLFAETPWGDKSDFVRSVYQKILKGGTLTPAQARGVLNYFRRDIVKHLKGRAAFEKSLGL